MLNRRHILALLGLSLVPGFARAQDGATKGAEAGAEGSAGEIARLPGGATLELGPAEPFSWESLVARARRMRGEVFQEKPHPAPETVARIGYEQHAAIRQPVGGGLFSAPGRDGIVTGFHLGELQRRAVRLHRVDDGEARELLYRKGYFSYPEDSPAADMPDDAGFAGFRVHGPWDGGAEPGDWLAFLGASYFRSSGDLTQYGISARGLALETVKPGGGPEEFPAFTEFWVSEMTGGTMMVHALLEGPSVVGAFRFEVRHFPNVVMDTDARIFLRGDIGRFGAAPLTSMYWYSQEKRWANGDWRPEVHDSDGLLVRDATGAALWRPLTNPAETTVTAFPLDPAGGFGLMQRDRDYGNYQDRASFERRPNLWVEPLEGFENGEVQLVELPTSAEYGDNIVAFFVPDEPALAGSDFAFRYRLHWSGGEPAPADGAAVARLVSHRLGGPRLNDRNEEPRLERKIIADFAGGPLAGRVPEAAMLGLDLSRGSAFRPGLTRLPYRDDGWRLEFDLFSQGPEPVDVRVRLHDGDEALSEEVVIRVWPEAE